jgi:hypothetical protein
MKWATNHLFGCNPGIQFRRVSRQFFDLSSRHRASVLTFSSKRFVFKLFGIVAAKESYLFLPSKTPPRRESPMRPARAYRLSSQLGL